MYDVVCVVEEKGVKGSGRSVGGYVCEGLRGKGKCVVCVGKKKKLVVKPCDSVPYDWCSGVDTGAEGVKGARGC